MPPDPMMCERVDREDLDTRYLAGALAEADALAFEAHFFECDRCWRLVRTGTDLRAAARDATGARAAPPVGRRSTGRWLRWSWIPIAAAAALALVWIGARDPARPGVESGDTIRGSADVLATTARLSEGQLSVRWSAASEATAYQVLLFDGRGALLWQRQVADTVVATPRDSLPELSGPLFAQVRALDLMGATIARSALVDVTIAPDGR